MAAPREYSRSTDVDSEGRTMLLGGRGDSLDREISNIKEWMTNIDGKVDEIIKDGCSHRGNDLAKLSRIEVATEGIRTEAGKVKDSVHGLALSFESHKTDLVRSSGTTDNKINNLKVGILIQCALLLLALVGFLVKEFVITKPEIMPPISTIQYDSGKVVLDRDVFQELVRDKKNK